MPRPRYATLIFMTLDSFIPTVSLLIAALGWYVVHHLSARRAQLELRRQKRLSYLIELYRTLYDLASNGIRDRKSFELFRNALNDIHLFGTPRHIEIAQDVIRQIGETHGRVMDIGLLIRYLQDDLRSELGLEAVDKYGVFLGWGGPEVADDEREVPTPLTDEAGSVPPQRDKIL